MGKKRAEADEDSAVTIPGGLKIGRGALDKMTPGMVAVVGILWLTYLAGNWIGPNVIVPTINDVFKPAAQAFVESQRAFSSVAMMAQTFAQNDQKRMEWGQKHEEKWTGLIQTQTESFQSLREEIKAMRKP